MLLIRTFIVTPFAQNLRVFIDTDSSECIVIDPGGEQERVLSYISKENLKVEKIILTHSHIDHVGGLAKFEEGLRGISQGSKPELLGHQVEKEMRSSIGFQCEMFGLPQGSFQNAREPDRYLTGGESLEFGPYKLEALFTPGHAPGHLSFFINQPGSWRIEWDRGEEAETSGDGPLVIAGDALFQGSIGRTDLPGGNHDQLISSIKEQLLTLPAKTRVLAGHGPDTDIETETSTNPFLK